MAETPPRVALSIAFKASGDRTMATATVRASDQPIPWSCTVWDKTPQAAVKAVMNRIRLDLSSSRRGRKPRGYRALLQFQYGW